MLYGQRLTRSFCPDLEVVLQVIVKAYNDTKDPNYVERPSACKANRKGVTMQEPCISDVYPFIPPHGTYIPLV